MVLEWMLGRLAGGVLSGSRYESRYGPLAGSCEYGDETAGSESTDLVTYFKFTFFNSF
jgi:hypothetical protein